MQVQIDPHGSTLSCDGTYITSSDDMRNFELISSLLVRAQSEKRYVDILVTNDNPVFPGRARIAVVTLLNTTW
jgi:hypothetical protein